MMVSQELSIDLPLQVALIEFDVNHRFEAVDTPHSSNPQVGKNLGGRKDGGSSNLCERDVAK